LKNLPAVLGLSGWLRFLLLRFLLQAQTIAVDVSHPTNHFVPNQTLGAGVDRIAVEAIDKDFLQPTLEKTMASGWQPVTYRQNTELARRGVALESARNMERRTTRQRIFHRLGDSDGNHPLFLWLCAAAPRIHPQRRYRQRGLLAAHGWRSEYFLEEQSVSHATLHRRKRCACIRSGWCWIGPGAADRQYSHRLGRALCPALRRCSTGRATIPSRQ
jgi:hypothetical protein